MQGLALPSCPTQALCPLCEVFSVPIHNQGLQNLQLAPWLAGADDDLVSLKHMCLCFIPDNVLFLKFKLFPSGGKGHGIWRTVILISNSLSIMNVYMQSIIWSKNQSEVEPWLCIYYL